MKIVLVADTFLPHRSSAAIQLYDLTEEFVRQGVSLLVIVPDANISNAWELEEINSVQLLRLKSPRIKGVGYVRRTLAEMVMPFKMISGLQKSPFANAKWEGIVFYSPSIFHGPLISKLKKSNDSKVYLIIRDIFPDWALDLGLLRKGLVYYFFRAVANHQNSLANIIGVQSAGNKRYFLSWLDKKPDRQLQVLNNWLSTPWRGQCSLQVEKTPLAGRKIFVYAGNIGVAQGLKIFLDLAYCLQFKTDVGFLFVGRGADLHSLKSYSQSKNLTNVYFADELAPNEMANLYCQCHAGIVALDSRHKSHNIPGKFLNYLQNGLPILANINRGNDLVQMIRREQVGVVCETNKIDDLVSQFNILLTLMESDDAINSRCLSLFEQKFTSSKAALQILNSLK